MVKRSREGESDGGGDGEDEEEGQDDEANRVIGDVEGSKTEVPKHEDEYVDEEKYTTVTIEPMDASDAEEDDEDDNDSDGVSKDETKADGKPKVRPTVKEVKMPDGTVKEKRIWTKEKPTGPKQKKKKVKKFRYESKVERKATRSKQRARNNDAAKTRREAGKS